MDPPTTSSSFSFQNPRHEKKSVAKQKQKQQHNHDDQTTATLTTTATTKSLRQHHHHHHHSNTCASPKLSPPHKLLSKHNSKNKANNRMSQKHHHRHHHSTNNNPHYIKSRNATKIIKGEIHNVCLTMRSDPRYYNNNNNCSSGTLRGDTATTTAMVMRQTSRFEYEDYCHPILMGLRNLHDLLSVMEVDGIFSLSNKSALNNSGGVGGGGGGNINTAAVTDVVVDGVGVGRHNKKSAQSPRRRTNRSDQRNSDNDNDDLLQSPLQQHLTTQITAVTFVSPFTQAVCSPDITAKTTGAALNALHKFILYGFIGGHHDDDVAGSSSSGWKQHHVVVEDEYGDDQGGMGMGLSSLFVAPSSSSSSGEGESNNSVIGQSITMIAECIRQCSFEDYCSWNNDHNVDGSSSSSASAGGGSLGRGMFSFWSRSGDNDTNNTDVDGVASSLELKNNGNNIKQHELPSFLTQPRRQNSSKGSSRNNSNNNNNSGTPSRKKKKKQSTNKTHSIQHQDVILKLLSLSVQVLRCPAGRQYLSPKDIVGIFDTCLHVAIDVAGENDSLLRSAAADALSHCVIVVFGMRGERGSGGCGRRRYDYIDGGNESDDESDSDDDWGERDPTEEFTNDNSSNSDDDANESKSYSSDAGEHIIQNEGNESIKEVNNGSHDDDNADDELALVPLMHRLATLSDPLIHEDDTCVLALTLINIALETMSDVDALAVRYPRLLSIMQNDLCRNLLRLSTSNDLSILGLALRVIFNLFNGIKDHLKVQLEVFLTSVHLRVLSFSVSPQTHERVWACSPERRELALESLLEFCREPMLMADLYLNYDCDMNCTNLFETICATLSKLANPAQNQQVAIDADNNDDTDSIDDSTTKPKLNILNRLALDGILAVIDAIARKCRSSPKFSNSSAPDTPTNNDGDLLTLPSPPDSGNSDFLGSTLYIQNDSLHESLEFDHNGDLNHSDASESGIGWPTAQNILRERKIQKRRLAKAATEFNERSRDKEWIKEAERVGVLPTPATPSSVASFLYSTPKLDLAKIGLYLSKGPKDKYPFHSEVLREFASLFDFDGMSFSDALRSFLSRFRLPGEAQCIDRLMESFANRLYEVSNSYGSGGDNDQAVEKAMLDPPCTNEPSDRSGTLDPPAAAEEEVNVSFPFKSADAAFILSFSTIMLNTDLHNPNMKDEKRMTLEQFIRNNRGINDGADLPLDFLTNLYFEIKNDEIQVKQDLLQDGVNNFDGLLANANDVAQPFFTSSNSAHNLVSQVGIHERDMFVSISSAAIEAISAVYVDSWDDALVVKALDGLRNCAFVAAYFGLGSIFNQVLEMLLGFGQDYVTSVATFMYSEIGKNKEFGRVEVELAARGIPPLPKSFLRKSKRDVRSRSILLDVIDIDGSAAHRGLLSLDCALALSRDHLTTLDEAWPTLLDVIFALREVEALPASLSDLDDFADSRGNPLPPSTFARNCKSRVNAYRESLAPVQSTEKGFWRSIFGSSQSSAEPPNHSADSHEEFPLYEALESISCNAQLDNIIAKTDDIGLAKRILFALFHSMIPDEDDALSDPLFESNAVFVLELAARFLISNRNNAAELYPVFLSKFELLLSPKSSQDDSHEHHILGLKFPYVLERIIVAILRSQIHFYDIENCRLREELNRSLRLITQLPSDYLHEVSDRLGCGSAIILRGCFFLFDERAEDWSIIKRLLDLAAQDSSGRGFVFDGIASVIDSIDYTLPGTEECIDSNELQLSQCGVEVIASLLLRYRDGSYEGDLSFRVPAMSYITKVYSYSQHFGTSNEVSSEFPAKNETALQEYEFHTMVTAIYKDACLSPEDSIAKRGFESLQGIVLSTKVESIPVGKWLDFLDMVASNSPSISVQAARISSLGLIGRLFLTLMPELSNEKDNWSQLEDFTISSASVVNENLRAGRATALFETTVETITNVVNVLSVAKQMSMATAEGESFCAWVSETLLYELEQVGACGGITNTNRPE
eukprot:scaffold27064_cov167-Skeletonema_menzelii.AAC.20